MADQFWTIAILLRLEVLDTWGDFHTAHAFFGGTAWLAALDTPQEH